MLKRIGASAVIGLVLVAGLLLGGAVDDSVLPGIPSPGPLTEWALPSVTLLAELLAVLTVGGTVTAAFLLPGDGPSVSAHGWRLLRIVTWLAAGQAVAVLVTVVLQVSDLLAVPVPELAPNSIAGFAFSVGQGQALLLQVLLALAVAVLSRASLSRGTAGVAAVTAVLAVVPPAFTGHAAGAGDHQLAVSSLTLHIVAASLWAGGLAGLLLVRRSPRFAETAARYSHLALLCFAMTALSGTVNAMIRLGGWDGISSRYGALLALKVLALLAAGVIGAIHRRRALWDGRFARLAAGETVLLGAAVALAVALSRSPTPNPTDGVDADPMLDLLGFEAPPIPSALRFVTLPLPDLFYLSAAVAAAVVYLAGVRRLRRAGHHWPASRTVSWLAGVLVFAGITGLGIARYAYVLFSVHMIQHMVLSMLVPILLVGGAPVTLALRTLRKPADPQVRGAREWLLVILHSRVTQVLTHPMVALAIYAGSLFGLYMSGLLGTIMRYHAGHLIMTVHFVVAGYLMFWVLIGIDPGRRRIHPALLTLVHFLAMAAHAFFGFVLLQSTTIIGLDWYAAVHPDWAPPLAYDQRLGAGLAWAFGEMPAAAIMLILVRQWIRSDEREQARLDRAADRADASGAEDELARYNEFLAGASAHDRTR